MVMDDRCYALAEIRDNALDYAEAYSYWDGSRTEVFASPLVARALRAAGGHFNVNIARRPIDAVLDRLAVAAVTVVEDEPAEEGEPTPDTAGETLTDILLRDVWIPNEMDLEWPAAMRKALAYGDGYLHVWPSIAEDGSITGVDVNFNEPTTTRVFYDEENPRRKVFAAKAWHAGENRWRLTLTYPDRIERWITIKGTTGNRPADFEPYVDDVDEDDDRPEPHIEPNPYGVIPVFHLRVNERPYGRPEHKDVFGAQDAITKLLATLMSTVDYHGAPQRYALTGRRTTDEVTDLFDDDDEDGTSKPDAGMSNLTSGPGQLWLLRNVDQIGQLDPADVDAFLKPVQTYVRFAAAMTATPIRYFEPTGLLPSGAAADADEGPLLKKCEVHEKEFGGELTNALEFAMQVLGHPVEVAVRWQPGQSLDDLEGWQTANEKIKAGVPVRQALLEAGYTSTQVDEWMYDHDENDMKRRVELLVQLGAAVQSLGAGVALGVVTAENVADVIASVMPDTGEDDANA